MTQPASQHGSIALRTARQWLDAGEPVALATVVETWGSAAVPVGGQLAIRSDTDFHGSVSGGCVEADVIAEAADVVHSGVPKLLTFGVSDDRAWNAGLACGGRIRILLQALRPDQHGGVLADIERAADARHAVVVETAISNGRMYLYRQTGDDTLTPDVRDVLRTGTSRLIESAATTTFLHAHTPTPRVVIVGATHIATVLAPLARLAGYDCVVTDPRQSFANASRFPDTALRVGWPSDVLPDLTLDSHSALVTLTHAEHIDDEALTIGLRGSCRYIGALGSRKTHAARVERLREKGFSSSDTDRIHAPVGLDLGGRSAGEIAVAILAEIVRTFRLPAADGAVTPQSTRAATTA